jgi:leucyl/phenylalanyl-tRNA--protein transferase
MFYGESMFARRTDASKAALAGLVGMLKAQGFTMIDCQQTTSHLGSLGGRAIPRQAFLEQIAALTAQPSPDWPSMQVTFPAV